MPPKQTIESIEAELKAGEIARIKVQFLEKLIEIEEMEKELQDIEAARGLLESNRLKPLPERMAALGMSQEATDSVQKYLDAFEKLDAGGALTNCGTI